MVQNDLPINLFRPQLLHFYRLVSIRLYPETRHKNQRLDSQSLDGQVIEIDLNIGPYAVLLVLVVSPEILTGAVRIEDFPVIEKIANAFDTSWPCCHLANEALADFRFEQSQRIEVESVALVGTQAASVLYEDESPEDECNLLRMDCTRLSLSNVEPDG